jgi:hypothetical protein
MNSDERLVAIFQTVDLKEEDEQKVDRNRTIYRGH